MWVKHENHTPLGTFKVRGGLVYFDDLVSRKTDCAGVIAATRGNHGQSVAFAAQQYGLRAVLVAPRGNSPEKNAAMEAHGAELIEHGDDFQAAFDHAALIATRDDLHFVPSFHPALVRGVASYALELFGCVSQIDTLYVAIGLAPAYARSLEAKRPISARVSETVADGLACRTPDPIAFEAIQRGMARLVAVSEEEICEAMRLLFFATHNVSE